MELAHLASPGWPLCEAYPNLEQPEGRRAAAKLGFCIPFDRPALQFHFRCEENK